MGSPALLTRSHHDSEYQVVCKHDVREVLLSGRVVVIQRTKTKQGSCSFIKLGGGGECHPGEEEHWEAEGKEGESHAGEGQRWNGSSWSAEAELVAGEECDWDMEKKENADEIAVYYIPMEGILAEPIVPPCLPGLYGKPGIRWLG